jgi:putative nucleotidyltransferase with HDIG domain
MNDRRWESRPVLSRLVRLAAFLAPIAISIIVASIVSALMPTPTTTVGVVGWWIAFVASIVIPLILLNRLVRRVLPLAALLELTLVFPDEAPSRFAVAKSAGRTRDLRKKLADSSESEPTEAAALVLALISSLGDHDRATRGHSERVRAFTDMLAEQVGVPVEDREKLRWAALLHDIGKLEVASEILNKPGDPDDTEWEVIKHHPHNGARLLGPLSVWLGPWVGAVAHHHEHWDGTGYELGLKGEEISFGGRIIAIADSYEVMTAARPYKKPLAPEAARRELAKCAGTHFDPRLVRSFLDISIGRLWRTVGAAAFLAQLPVLGGLSYRGIAQKFGRATATVATTVATVGALVTGGGINTASIPHPSVPSEVVAQGTEAETTPAPDATPDEPTSHPHRGGTTTGSTNGPHTAPDGGSDDTDPETSSSDDPADEPNSEGPGDPHEGEGSGEDPFVADGDILAAGVLHPALNGATESEFLTDCMLPSTQGIDAWVFDVSARPGGANEAALAGTGGVGTATLEGRAYDADCTPLSDFTGSKWALPSATQFLVVVAPQAVQTHVNLRISLAG